jgi:hypothetical protein
MFSRPRRAARSLRGGFALFAILILGNAANTAVVLAQQSKPAEYQVKAVYLYNFGKFVEWPATAEKENSFAICILGRDPFGPALDSTLTGEKIDNRTMVARRIVDVQEAAQCQILFVASSEAARMKQVLASLGKSSVLTVSDLPDFSASGGMIQFVLDGGKVRFEVNLTAADKAGLTLSSQLLKVATAVKRDSPPDNAKP